MMVQLQSPEALTFINDFALLYLAGE